MSDGWQLFSSLIRATKGMWRFIPLSPCHHNWPIVRHQTQLGTHYIHEQQPQHFPNVGESPELGANRLRSVCTVE